MADFQFLTTSDPEEFKQEQFLKRIRSHAMLNTKHKEQNHSEHSKPQQPAIRPSSSRRSQSIARTGQAEQKTPLFQVGRPHKFVAHDPSTISGKGVRKRSSGNEDEEGDPIPDALPRRLSRAKGKALSRYVQAAFKCNPGPQKTGTGPDPLCSMPEFSNPNISIWELKRRFDEHFITTSMMTIYFPAMDGCRHAFLSTACIKSSYADTLNGRVEESPLTLCIKEEVYELIRESFRDPVKRADDGMFITIGQLLCAEIVQGEEDVQHTHEQGLERIVKQRGSLDAFGGQGLFAAVVCFVVYLSCIVREGRPPSTFHAFLNHQTPATASERLHESPIWCPRSDFHTIIGLCSECTLDILREMRDMTELILLSEGLLKQEWHSASEEPYPSHLNDHLWSVHNHMRVLPTAADISRSPTDTDFVYEACRHAALLYSYSIAARVPISVAARHLENAASPHLDTAYETETAALLRVPSSASAHPSLAILTAIQQSPNVNQAWGDLIGVLLWVTLVATTAARGPPPTPTHPSPSALETGAGTGTAAGTPGSRSGSSGSGSERWSPPPAYAYSLEEWRRDRERKRARKSLAMMAALCCIKLGFGQPATLLSAQRRFLRVQALLQR